MPAPHEENVARWIERAARLNPSRLAWADDHRRVDYGEALDRVTRLAQWFTRQGVRHGDRVAVWVSNRGVTLEALFAAAQIGAIVLPVNSRLTPSELAFQFDDCTPSVLLVEAEWQERAAETLELMSQEGPLILSVGMNETGDDYEAALRGSPSEPVALPDAPVVGAEDPLILMYTSGTTGRPKGALLPHRKALYNALNAEIYFGIEATDRVLVVAPLFHSLGLQILALPAIHKGAGLVIQEGFDPARVWRAIKEEEISYFGGVPTMHQRLLAQLSEAPSSALPPHLRFAFTAGAAAPIDLIHAFARHGLPMKQGYGQTETSTLTCLSEERILSKAGSVGQPVHHAEIRLIDPKTIDGPVAEWRDVAIGEVGEIVVRGPINMLGYWQRPGANAETLRGEWLRTGDLATRDEDFDITLVGRAREMYISGGENVYPAEVEATLVLHPEVHEVAVVAEPSPEWGEIGRAHIVAVPGTSPRPDEILEWLSTRLARYKQPRSIVIESALPRTASGKVQKHNLRAPGDHAPADT